MCMYTDLAKHLYKVRIQGCMQLKYPTIESAYVAGYLGRSLPYHSVNIKIRVDGYDEKFLFRVDVANKLWYQDLYERVAARLGKDHVTVVYDDQPLHEYGLLNVIRNRSKQVYTVVYAQHAPATTEAPSVPSISRAKIVIGQNEFSSIIQQFIANLINAYASAVHVSKGPTAEDWIKDFEEVTRSSAFQFTVAFYKSYTLTINDVVYSLPAIVEAQRDIDEMYVVYRLVQIATVFATNALNALNAKRSLQDEDATVHIVLQAIDETVEKYASSLYTPEEQEVAEEDVTEEEDDGAVEAVGEELRFIGVRVPSLRGAKNAFTNAKNVVTNATSGSKYVSFSLASEANNGRFADMLQRLRSEVEPGDILRLHVTSGDAPKWVRVDIEESVANERGKFEKGKWTTVFSSLIRRPTSGNGLDAPYFTFPLAWAKYRVRVFTERKDAPERFDEEGVRRFNCSIKGGKKGNEFTWEQLRSVVASKDLWPSLKISNEILNARVATHFPLPYREIEGGPVITHFPPNAYKCLQSAWNNDRDQQPDDGTALVFWTGIKSYAQFKALRIRRARYTIWARFNNALLDTRRYEEQAIDNPEFEDEYTNAPVVPAGECPHDLVYGSDAIGARFSAVGFTSLPSYSAFDVQNSYQSVNVVTSTLVDTPLPTTNLPLARRAAEKRAATFAAQTYGITTSSTPILTPSVSTFTLSALPVPRPIGGAGRPDDVVIPIPRPLGGAGGTAIPIPIPRPLRGGAASSSVPPPPSTLSGFVAQWTRSRPLAPNKIHVYGVKAGELGQRVIDDEDSYTRALKDGYTIKATVILPMILVMNTGQGVTRTMIIRELHFSDDSVNVYSATGIGAPLHIAYDRTAEDVDLRKDLTDVEGIKSAFIGYDSAGNVKYADAAFNVKTLRRIALQDNGTLALVVVQSSTSIDDSTKKRLTTKFAANAKKLREGKNVDPYKGIEVVRGRYELLGRHPSVTIGPDAADNIVRYYIETFKASRIDFANIKTTNVSANIPENDTDFNSNVELQYTIPCIEFDGDKTWYFSTVTLESIGKLDGAVAATYDEFVRQVTVLPDASVRFFDGDGVMVGLGALDAEPNVVIALMKRGACTITIGPKDQSDLTQLDQFPVARRDYMNAVVALDNAFVNHQSNETLALLRDTVERAYAAWTRQFSIGPMTTDLIPRAANGNAAAEFLREHGKLHMSVRQIIARDNTSDSDDDSGFGTNPDDDEINAIDFTTAIVHFRVPLFIIHATNLTIDYARDIFIGKDDIGGGINLPYSGTTSEVLAREITRSAEDYIMRVIYVKDGAIADTIVKLDADATDADHVSLERVWQSLDVIAVIIVETGVSIADAPSFRQLMHVVGRFVKKDTDAERDAFDAEWKGVHLFVNYYEINGNAVPVLGGEDPSIALVNEISRVVSRSPKGAIKFKDFDPNDNNQADATPKQITFGVDYNVLLYIGSEVYTDVVRLYTDDTMVVNGIETPGIATAKDMESNILETSAPGLHSRIAYLTDVVDTKFKKPSDCIYENIWGIVVRVSPNEIKKGDMEVVQIADRNAYIRAVAAWNASASDANRAELAAATRAVFTQHTKYTSTVLDQYVQSLVSATSSSSDHTEASMTKKQHDVVEDWIQKYASEGTLFRGPGVYLIFLPTDISELLAAIKRGDVDIGEFVARYTHRFDFSKSILKHTRKMEIEVDDQLLTVQRKFDKMNKRLYINVQTESGHVFDKIPVHAYVKGEERLVASVRASSFLRFDYT